MNLNEPLPTRFTRWRARAAGLAKSRRLRLVAFGLLIAAIAVYFALRELAAPADAGLAGGNGRLEAQPVDVAAKNGGRIDELLVDEGDDVAAGQLLARMDVRALEAQQAAAEAQRRQALQARASAEAAIAQQRSALASAEALIAQRRSELDLAGRVQRRSDALAGIGAVSAQQAEADRSRLDAAQAQLEVALAQRRQAGSAVTAAAAQADEAAAAIEAAAAQVRRLQVDIDDGRLLAPRAGRVQYRVAQAGEIVPAGGKVLSLVDLHEIYMNFFLPERQAGRVAVGAEARIVLDAAPQAPIPAHIVYVASVAQFTPKTVETAEEREKLMFRVKARVDEDALAGPEAARLKSGSPGMAYVRIDGRDWPARLQAPAP